MFVVGVRVCMLCVVVASCGCVLSLLGMRCCLMYEVCCCCVFAGVGGVLFSVGVVVGVCCELVL